MSQELAVTKSSGEQVNFSRHKLIRSLQRAGADGEMIERIVREVENSLYPGIKTSDIYDMAFRLLRHKERPVAGRYKLKRAIMELGPSGYPFEKFIGALFRHEGFRVETSILVPGKCVRHEVDVMAFREKEQHVVECKYHNLGGIMCDVKVPLYIHSRFRDIEAYKYQHSEDKLQLHGWVVTNTRFSDDAIQYAECAGLRLMGWSYPDGASLRNKVDSGALYPLTCLTSITKSEKQLLLTEGIVLCRDIPESRDLLLKAGVNPQRIARLMQEVKEITGQ